MAFPLSASITFIERKTNKLFSLIAQSEKQSEPIPFLDMTTRRCEKLYKLMLSQRGIQHIGQAVVLIIDDVGDSHRSMTSDDGLHRGNKFFSVF